MKLWEIALLCVGGGAALVVVAEFVLRALIRRGKAYYVWAPRSQLHMHLEPGVIPSQGPFVRFDVNKVGERGDEPPADMSDVFRVLVAGGSAVECYFLDQPQSWPEILKRELARPERLDRLGARAVHLGNIGKSLVGTEFIERILGNIAPRYPKLDCLVFMVGASNVVGWLIKKTPATLPDDAEPPSDVYDVHPNVKYSFRGLRLALRERLMLRLRGGKPVVRQGAGKKLIAARLMRKRATTILEATPDPAPMLEHFDRNLRRMLRRAKSMAKRVVVVPQAWFDREPTPEERDLFWHGAQGQPYTEEVKTYYTSTAMARLMRLVEERQIKVAAEEGCECCIISDVVEPSLKVFYDYLHYTPEGAERVGRHIAEFIAKNAVPLTRPSPRSR